MSAALKTKTDIKQDGQPTTHAGCFCRLIYNLVQKLKFSVKSLETILSLPSNVFVSQPVTAGYVGE